MRTGMIRTQKTIRRVPSIKSPSLAASFNKLSGAKKKLTFADSYSSKQKNLTRVASDPSDNLSSIMSHEKLDESSKWSSKLENGFYYKCKTWAFIAKSKPGLTHNLTFRHF